MILRQHGGGKAQSRVQWSGCRLAVLHTMVLKEIVLTLGEKKATIGTISTDFKTQELSPTQLWTNYQTFSPIK